MLSMFCSWWQKAKKPVEIAVVSIFILGLIVLVILVILGTIFQWNWTGLGPETSDPKQHAKTLWDWLQLLIIPAVLAVGGYLFNYTTSRNERRDSALRAQTEREIAKKRDQTERDLAFDNQREAALQAYVDKMSELLLDRKLRESTEDGEVRNIARVRTLTVLPRLDAERKGSVLQFLHESRLLKKNECILDLTGADLSKASLSFANLRDADLRDVDLSEADLSFADLRGADLRDADFKGADLSNASLNFADLSKAYLSIANLNKANLRGVDLSEATLRGADLSGTDFRGADLRAADLSEAYLRGADLSGADLSEATLRRAKIDQPSLDKAHLIKEQRTSLIIIAPP